MRQQEKLQSVTLEAAELSNDITNRKQLLERIEAKILQAEEVCHSSENYSYLKSNVADQMHESIKT